MDIRKITAAAREQGWQVTTGGDGHLRFFNADGYAGEMPSTPSSATSIRNNLARLRRAGLVYPVDRKRARALARRPLT